MKIPKQAELKYKGEVFDVYGWEQTMFDGSTAPFEMIKRAGTVEVIAVKEGKIWYAEQEQPVKGKYLSFFGGRIEPNETPETGAARELLEESGLKAEKLELYSEVMPMNKMDWTNYIFLALNCQTTTAQNPDPGEKIVIKSCSFEELIEMILKREIKTNPLFVISIFEAVYRTPNKLIEFKKKLGL